MNVVLLYLQRNKNLLDFAIGTSLVGLENFEVVIFVGPSFCEILKGEGGGWGGGLQWYLEFFWLISYNIKN